MLRTDLMTGEAQALLHPWREWFERPPRRRQQQLRRLVEVPHERPGRRTDVAAPGHSGPGSLVLDRSTDGLEFFNGIGGFAKDRREYVTVLRAGQSTPAPWINVIANPKLRLSCRDRGQRLYLGQEQPREPADGPGRERPVLRPARRGDLSARRGHGRTVQPDRADPGRRDLYRDMAVATAASSDSAGDLALDLLQYVPLDDPIKISRLRVRNLSNRPRRLSVTSAEWVLGTSRGASAPPS